MTGLHLTPEAVQARRLELAEVDAQIKALGRRKSVLRAEILSGYAAPVKGAPAEQLPLVETTTATPSPEAPAQAPEAAKPATATTTARTAVQQREAVLAALRAAKGRRSGQVLATLLGESEQDVHECLMELIQRGEARSARRGGYEATDKPQPPSRDVKPGKAAKKPAAKAPAKKAKAAKGKKAEGTRSRTWTVAEDIEAVLREWGTWFEVGQLEAKVREALPLSLGPSTAEWNNALRGLIEVKKIQRREVDGQVQFRLAVAPEPKKKGKKAPEAPRPTVTVGEAMAKMLAEVSVHDWQQARAEVCERLAQRKGQPVSVGSLLLKVGCDSNLVTPVLELLEEASAVSLGYKAKSPSVVSLSAVVSDEEIAHDLQALTRRYVRGLVEDWGGDPTTADLAGNLELPAALIDSVLIELRAAQELLCDREGRWSVRSPKASAAARTAPLFDDVEPAPAVDGLEPEGDEP
mgnify:FL=1